MGNIRHQILVLEKQAGLNKQASIVKRKKEKGKTSPKQAEIKNEKQELGRSG
jgi:hypothetical protein